MEQDYDKIADINDYNQLIHSGMFFEFYPDLTGDYETDMTLITELESKMEGE